MNQEWHTVSKYHRILRQTSLIGINNISPNFHQKYIMGILRISDYKNIKLDENGKPINNPC